MQQKCSPIAFTMPQSIAVGNKAFENFIKVMSLPSGKRQAAFSELSNEEKASVIKVKLALEFVKRPDLTKEQNSLILDTISKISADTYDRANREKVVKSDKDTQELQAKALVVFSPNEAYEIFANLNGEKIIEINLLTKYKEVLSLRTIGKRQQMFRDATTLEKSNIWKAQMIFHLATARLNKSQLEFIEGTIPLLTSNAFDLPTVEGQLMNEDTKALNLLKPKAFELFSKEEVFAIFMSLGIQEPIAARDIEYEPERRPCECNWWCGASSLCNAGGCNMTNSGCGWYGNDPCVMACS